MTRRPNLSIVLLAVAATAMLGTPAVATYPSQTLLAQDVRVSFLRQSPDGRFVVYARRLADRDEVWSLALDGSTDGPVRLSDPSPAGGNVNSYTVSDDSSRVVWTGDLTTDTVIELYSAPIDRSGEQVRLNATPTVDGGVRDAIITPDSQHVVFTGDLDTDTVIEIYSAPIDAGGQQVRLNDTPAPGGGVSFYQPRITSDSSRVVYQGDLDTDGTTELYSAPVDVPGQQVRLNDTPVSGGNVDRVLPTPDGSRVVYSGDLTVDGREELFSAPIDTAGEQVLLSDPPVAGGDVHTFDITDDSSWVVFSGDLSVDTQDALFSAPTDRAGRQTTLAEPVADGDVMSYLLVPGTHRVVLRGDLDTDERFELYGTSADGTTFILRLNDPPVPGGDVTNSRLTPDGTRVVYTGNIRRAGRVELFSAPIDDNGGQVRLSQVLGPDGVIHMKVTPDGTRVVYTAQTVEGSRALHSAPVDTAGQQVRLSDTPVADRDVQGFEIAPDGGRVAFWGDLRVDGLTELFSAPIATADAMVGVSEPPPAGGGIDTDDVLFPPDSSFTLYFGQLEVDERVDIYGSGVGQTPPRPVTALTASDVTDDAVTLVWEPPAFGTQVTSYEVTVEPTSARRVSTVVDGDMTTVTVDGLTPATAHTATVVAVNDAGPSPEATIPVTTTGEPGGVFRLDGDTRFDTAAAVALDRFDPSDVEVVYLATGRNFPDALAGGPLAAHMGAPILLVEPTALPEITRTTLATLDPDKVIALGGTTAVNDDVLAAAGTAADATTSRLSGPDRYATATAIADALVAAGGNTERAFLAIGTNFPDAVAAGPATNGAPILLTPGTALADATATWLTDITPAAVTAVGGTAVLTDDTLAAATTAAGGATPARLAGDNRYATATAIAATLGTGDDAPDTVYIAVGTNFPDALTGGPAAAAEGAPIILVEGAADTIPADTRTYLDGLPALRRIIVLGGTTAIPEDITTTLETLLDTR